MSDPVKECPFCHNGISEFHDELDAHAMDCVLRPSAEARAEELAQWIRRMEGRWAPCEGV